MPKGKNWGGSPPLLFSPYFIVNLIVNLYYFNMNYSKEFYASLLVKMRTDRKIYLDEAHTKEKEVHICTKGFHKNCEYFYLDGFRIWMPEHLQYVNKYKKYLFNMV